MNERGGFPWRCALAATALLGLSLLTVGLRAQVVREGQELVRREHVRLSLRRHARELTLRLQEASQDLGQGERAAREAAGRKGKVRS